MSEAQWTAHEAVQRLTSGDIGSVELIDALITRIESEDERVNAYVHLDADAARAQAQDVDERRKRGAPLGPLAGVQGGINTAIQTIYLLG